MVYRSNCPNRQRLQNTEQEEGFRLDGDALFYRCQYWTQTKRIKIPRMFADTFRFSTLLHYFRFFASIFLSNRY